MRKGTPRGQSSSNAHRRLFANRQLFLRELNGKVAFEDSATPALRSPVSNRSKQVASKTM